MRDKHPESERAIIAELTADDRAVMQGVTLPERARTGQVAASVSAGAWVARAAPCPTWHCTGVVGAHVAVVGAGMFTPRLHLRAGGPA